MKARWVSSDDDVVAIAEFNGAAIAAVGHSGYIHPGDVFHRTYGGNRRFDPSRTIHVWEDGDGIAAWVSLQPGHPGFDLQVRPDLRDVEWETELVAWTLDALVELLQATGSSASQLVADAFTDDPVRNAALEAGGWARGNEPYFLTRRSTADPLPVELPEGYVVRSVGSADEPEVVSALHMAAFGSNWQPGEYARYAANPGYSPERELLAVAPSGELAAFTVTWHDSTSGIGLFEPVGTHPDHRKRGLGRAMLAAGLERMAAAGLEAATVAFEGDNPGSRALYLGSGFEIAHKLIDYTWQLER